MNCRLTEEDWGKLRAHGCDDMETMRNVEAAPFAFFFLITKSLDEGDYSV